MLKVTVYVHVDEAIVSEEVNELMSYTEWKPGPAHQAC